MNNTTKIPQIGICEKNLKEKKSHLFMWFMCFYFFFISFPCFTQITRTQIINNAIPYTSFTWTATSSNIWNGKSCGGKTIQTPSWVKIGSNTGIPYCWGGWTSTSSFQGYLNSGKSAGDNNTATSFGVEPSCAVGLDCSGLVSRAWGLSSKYSTSTLTNISTSVAITQTQPGDILNLAGSHTRLIETNYGNGNYRVIESSATDWKTSYRTYTTAQLSSYTPRVYNNVSGGGTLPGSFTLTLTPQCNGTTSQIVLNWTAASGVSTYDIYRNGTLYYSDLQGTTFTNTGTNVVSGTTYQYYIKAKNTAGSTNSNTQSVVAQNCAPTPTIRVTSPNGGETWQAGSTQTITWTSSAVIGTVQIQPYLNGVAQTNIAASASNTGSYSWTIPSNFTPASTYKIAISAMSGTVSDFSNSNFTITLPVITCTYSLSKTSQNFPYSGGSGSFTINTTANSGCKWDISISPSSADDIANFTSISKGTGPYTITYSIDPNPTNSVLTSTYSVTGDNGYSQNFVITQDANTTCDPSFSSTNASFTSDGGTGSFNIVVGANCHWNITNSCSSMLTNINPTDGYGPTTVNYDVLSYSNSTPRSCKIHLQQNNNEYTVTQQGICIAPSSPTSVSASQTTINLGQSTVIQVVEGSLNDAPNWIWYTGSCGGTPIGTGATLTVSPITTTTFYVQASACGTTTICRSVTINILTNLNETSESKKIKINPNPTTGLLEISGIETLEGECKIEIFNNLGYLIYISEFEKIGNKLSLDLRTYPVGMYLIKLSNNSVTYQKKVIKK